MAYGKCNINIDSSAGGGTVNPDQVRDIVNEEIQSVNLQTVIVDGGKANTSYPDEQSIDFGNPNDLTTNSKQIVGAINEINAKPSGGDPIDIVTDLDATGLTDSQVPSALATQEKIAQLWTEVGKKFNIKNCDCRNVQDLGDILIASVNGRCALIDYSGNITTITNALVHGTVYSRRSRLACKSNDELYVYIINASPNQIHKIDLINKILVKTITPTISSYILCVIDNRVVLSNSTDTVYYDLDLNLIDTISISNALNDNYATVFSLSETKYLIGSNIIDSTDWTVKNSNLTSSRNCIYNYKSINTIGFTIIGSNTIKTIKSYDGDATFVFQDATFQQMGGFGRMQYCITPFDDFKKPVYTNSNILYKSPQAESFNNNTEYFEIWADENFANGRCLSSHNWIFRGEADGSTTFIERV